MNINEITGKEMRTPHCSNEYADGWERVFGQRNEGCRVPAKCSFPECGCDVTWKQLELFPNEQAS